MKLALINPFLLVKSMIGWMNWMNWTWNRLIIEWIVLIWLKIDYLVEWIWNVSDFGILWHLNSNWTGRQRCDERFCGEDSRRRILVVILQCGCKTAPVEECPNRCAKTRSTSSITEESSICPALSDRSICFHHFPLFSSFFFFYLYVVCSSFFPFFFVCVCVCCVVLSSLFHHAIMWHDFFFSFSRALIRLHVSIFPRVAFN